MDYFKPFGIEVGKGRYDEEAVYGIALVYTALFDRISGYLTKFNLTPAKMNVLMIIKHQGKKEGISQAEIGKRLMVTPSNMTRLLDKLIREGLVSRSVLVTDRRVKLIKVTAKGSAILDHVWPGYSQLIERLAHLLKSDDQKQIAILLQKWLGALKT